VSGKADAIKKAKPWICCFKSGNCGIVSHGKPAIVRKMPGCSFWASGFFSCFLAIVLRLVA
jgi:hypothetical protein